MKQFSLITAIGLMLAFAWSGSHATPDPLLQLRASAAPIQHTEAEALSRDLLSRVQRSASPGTLSRIRLLHQPPRPATQGTAQKTPSAAPASTPAARPTLPARKPSPRALQPRVAPPGQIKQPAATPPAAKPPAAKPAAPAPASPQPLPQESPAVTDFSKQLLHDAQRVGQPKGGSAAIKATGTSKKASEQQQDRLHAAPDESSKGQHKGNESKGKGKQRQGSFGGGQGPGKGLGPGKQYRR